MSAARNISIAISPRKDFEMTSTLVSTQQTVTPWIEFQEDTGQRCRIRATIRYDDRNKNGYNTFSLTAEIQEIYGRRWEDCAGGMLHNEVSKHFGVLGLYTKWHSCSANGPLHYISNTCYHAKLGNFKAARATAIWPDASEHDLRPEGLG
jgi:hypothetical protein